MVHGNASDDYSKKKKQNVTYKMIATIVMMIFSSMTRERERKRKKSVRLNILSLSGKHLQFNRFKTHVCIFINIYV